MVALRMQLSGSLTHGLFVRSSKQWKQAFTVADCHERTIFSVDWSKQGDFLVTGAADNGIRVFQGRPAGDVSSFDLAVFQKEAHASDINCVRWNPQLQEEGGKKSLLLASASDDAVVRIWKFNFP
jgi:WD40 repeat protein